MRRFRPLALVLVLLGAAPRTLSQVAPLGGEFVINTYTPGYQYAEAVAPLFGGGFVVTWRGNVTGVGGYEVLAQRYAASGAPLGTEFRVNAFTTNNQRSSSVAAWPAGFVVVWQSSFQDGSGEGVYGQRYDTAGAPAGPEFLIDTFTTLNQSSPSVAADTSGRFVVVWISPEVSSYEVVGQRYSSTGAPVGGEFQVNTYTTSVQARPSVASDGAGNFFVVWQSNGQDGVTNGIFGQRYASSGSPLGGEFQINTYTTGSQYEAVVASLGPSGFVVVWRDANGEDGSVTGVFGQRFAVSGAPAGSEFRVNTYTTNAQQTPAIAADSQGNFVVTWESNYQNGARPAGPAPLGGLPFGMGVFAQLYASSGAPVGAEFRVNTTTSRGQVVPHVGMNPAGNFMIAWSSDLSDGSNAAVVAQRYCSHALTSVAIGVMGSTTVCPAGTGGLASVTDTGGGPATHQWGYRTMSGGTVMDIMGQTGMSYTIAGSDFPGIGAYLLVETTTPTCGSATVSNEVMISVEDTTAPVVTSPPASTVTQTLCQ